MKPLVNTFLRHCICNSRWFHLFHFDGIYFYPGCFAQICDDDVIIFIMLLFFMSTSCVRLPFNSWKQWMPSFIKTNYSFYPCLYLHVHVKVKGVGFFKKDFVAQEIINLNISWHSNFFEKCSMALPINFSFLFKAFL